MLYPVVATYTYKTQYRLHLKIIKFIPLLMKSGFLVKSKFRLPRDIIFLCHLKYNLLHNSVLCLIHSDLKQQRLTVVCKLLIHNTGTMNLQAKFRNKLNCAGYCNDKSGYNLQRNRFVMQHVYKIKLIHDKYTIGLLFLWKLFKTADRLRIK